MIWWTYRWGALSAIMASSMIAMTASAGRGTARLTDGRRPLTRSADQNRGRAVGWADKFNDELVVGGDVAGGQYVGHRGSLLTVGLQA